MSVARIASRTTFPRAGTIGALLRQPLGIAAVAFVLYSAFAGAAIARHGATSFAFVDPARVATTHGSPTIDRYATPGKHGAYDGQFYLMIALDPVHAWRYVEWPAYRYSRIVYPMVARAAALGHPAWIPYTMIWLNIFAVSLGTLIVALLLRQRRQSPIYATAYFLFPGVVLGFMRDLTEPLAFALAALGVWLVADWKSRPRVAGAAVAFALAGLTREVTLVIPAALVLYRLFVARRSPRGVAEALLFGAVAAVPYKAWTIFLHHWLSADRLRSLGSAGAAGSASAAGGYHAPHYPFAGIIEARTTDVWSVVAVAAAGAFLTAACLYRFVRERDQVLLALIASLLVLNVFLHAGNYIEYFGCVRLQIGAAFLAIVSLDVLRRSRFSWLCTRIAFGLAYSPWVMLIAWAALYGVRPR